MTKLLSNSKGLKNLSGKFLIANPHVVFNEVFNKAVIYVASHTENGSIGLIVNHLVNKMPMKSVFKMLKADIDIGDLLLPVYLGGPVEPDRGFVLHSGDYDKNLLFKFSNELAVSSNLQILQDIANGSGPKDSLFVIGYTGWTAGQLEQELLTNHWLISDVDKNIIFAEDNSMKWQTALKNAGVDNSFLSSSFGQC